MFLTSSSSSLRKDEVLLSDLKMAEPSCTRKRHTQFNGPTNKKKGHRNGYLREEPPRQLDWNGDISTLAKDVSEVLGLRENFLKEVEFAPDDILNHRGLTGLTDIYIESAYYDIENQSLKKELSEELLKKVGFTDPSTIATLMGRAEKMRQHLEPLDFIMRFVNDEFEYNPKLSGQAQEDIPLPDGTDVFDIADYKNDEQSEPCEVTRLFHGTDLNSAVDIVNNGIELDFGRHKHDFSDGGGFYLTTSFEHAKTWARSQTRKPAVLEMKIPKARFEKARIWNLDVSTKEGRLEWDWIVRENRSGRPSKKLRQEPQKYDCIAGPISVSGCPSFKERVPKPNFYQICVVKRRFADEIEQDVKYTLYTDKNMTEK